MPTKCLSLVRGRRVRLTRLDGCGHPVYGECSTVVTKGFISVAFTANTTESDEINVTNAAGETCVYEPAETSLAGYSVEIQFCEVDPDLFALVTNQPTVTDSMDNVIGFDIDTSTSLDSGGFALELWAGSAAGDACDSGGSEGSYGYLLLPFIRGGIVGDFTVENGAVTFTITGGATRNGNSWGVGPYDDIQLDGTGNPGPMLSPIGTNVALRTILTDVAPPEAACGCRPLMDPSLRTVAMIMPDLTDSPTVTFELTPTPEGPVWVDFGDGTWDYVQPQDEIVHLYSKSGDYLVRATENGVWTEAPITITL